MSWRRSPPRRGDYDPPDEYDEALEAYNDALSDDADARYEARKLRDE